ncbi:glycoprotein 3-alpha-L-fucosyltransferase A [Scaptodrosophila lebanonensis]|uniref:Fucosyltransferase n=1 Tax=Drosophila lebanonensis TaxID=7225 RepID=A0A6J2TH27_DROLE|nr:glycoprotein 3-alpha-L-fucosyltransferase A [Scaptodrosophila lebanonensis]XP_030375314.1 glycoprotein 3-alpha-L-fucosyltransferase A [Scaptodrosophila lebanonensis]XP_030375315.1 glycoprotein 3-alpha-L-fucosyltransferase A [Scaptodrosophila lebanonensis]XP_030375316.1 glycoprotein 3-alpha-L-fucosyltransferase A [Scaptodrosophila lebanonensis]
MRQNIPVYLPNRYKKEWMPNMRRPKISLKKYFFFTLVCALLLIFGFNLKEYEIWKTKSARFSPSTEQQQDGQNKVKIVQSDEATSSEKHSTAIPRPIAVSDNNSLVPVDEMGSKKSAISKAWYFRNGDYHPKAIFTSVYKRHSSKLFPHQDIHNDRIVNQLMYVPENYAQIKASGKLKSILLYNGLSPWNVKHGREVFLRAKCPVDTCELTANRDLASTADMILYKDHIIPTGLRRPSNAKQVSMLYYLECPYHTQIVKVPDGLNWTATYRRDSTIVAPYEKWQYYDPKVQQQDQDHNFAVNKTKKVAWFVSNCAARNARLQYAHELQKHIEVDIYGACGNFQCARSNSDKCFEILDQDYKFYLAFENSNCRDYITEKFFVNALQRNVLPIVMGARPEDYEVSAPRRSYIHVDEFASPKELAEYLHILDRDDDLYNSYFKWKGTGEFINTYFWCRVCSTLHDEEQLLNPRWYPNVNEWWRGEGTCTIRSWRNYKARKDVITDD